MFRVEWHQVALDELTSLWMQADATQRQAVTTASHAIDQRLSTDPLNEGESHREVAGLPSFLPWLFVSRSRLTGRQ